MTLFFQACVSLPDVYVVDQATVLQNEAGGKWTNMEEKIRKSSIRATPAAFKQDVYKDKRTVYSVLNGDLKKKGEK